ncbi:DUF1270 family protein [Staphylococcus sp. NRL 16/872]|uniref:DUF1270 family protein n=1 Tax=Staphylococcus sp. NRL 16/872 TaxID=2930131 RepID=UPI001FB463EF|nr:MULTISPECIES: DUF1270 family protein [unclassified Staphylococcus]MCJ1667822.1 DUF1270 family protein [Staphylococcus sp. NRL 19/737]WEN70313.1 DUF1270 family protein [Staphylococcus sp. NRL 16/872]
MSTKDKTILITGLAFNTIFFASIMINIFITDAAGIALFTSLATYIFFDSYFYK